jgi:tetratricopeptide (TPR) repeat protein
VVLVTTTLLYSRAFDDNILAKSGLVAIGSGLVLLLAVAYLWLQGRVELLRLPVYPGAVVFAAVAAMGAMQAPAAGVVLESLLGYAALFGLFLVTAHRCRRVRSAVRLLWVLLAVQALVAAVGVLQYMGVDLLSSPAASLRLPVSTLGNPNFAAYYQELMLPVGLALVLSQWGRLSRWGRGLLAAAFTLGIVHLVLAQSRAGWLSAALAIGLLLALTVSRRAWLRHLGPAVLALLLLVPVAQLLLESVPAGRQQSLYGSVESTARRTWDRALTALDAGDFSRNMRVLLWAGAADMVLDHPWTGVGLGRFRTSLPAYLDHAAWGDLAASRGETTPQTRHAHNEYLEFPAEVGLLGAAALVWAVVALLRLGLRYLGLRSRSLLRGSRRPVRALTAGVVCAWVAALTHAWSGFNLHNPVVTLHLAVLSGLMVGLNSRHLSAAGRAAAITLVRPLPRALASGAAVAMAGLLLVAGTGLLVAESASASAQRLLASRQPEQAMLALNRAIQWRGHEFTYYRSLGSLAVSRQQDPIAMACLQRSLELNPNDAGVLRLMGGMFLRSGVDAVAPLAQAVALDPRQPQGYTLLAQAYRRAGAYQQAIATLQQGLNLLRPRADLLLALALAYRDAGDVPQCLTYLERAAAADPQDGRVAGNLGAIYLEMGRPVQAETELRRALTLAPQNRLEWKANLSWALRLQGRMEEARAAAVDAVVYNTEGLAPPGTLAAPGDSGRVEMP